jgi:hypothetical protein
VFSSVAGILAYIVVLYTAWLMAFVVTAIPIALLQRQINRRAIPVARSAPGFFRWRDYYASPFTTPLSARDMRLYGAKHLLR